MIVQKSKKTTNGHLEGVLISDAGEERDFMIFSKDITAEAMADFRPKADIVIQKYTTWNGKLIPQSWVVRTPAPIGISQEDTERFLEIIKCYLMQFDENLKQINYCEKLSSLIVKHEKEYCTAPAAVSHHHNYIGGLLQHTHELIEIADSLIKTLDLEEKVNTPLVYAGIILHDFAKIWEYKYDLKTGVIEYNTEFQEKWISHIHWAFTWCMSQGFTELAGIVATHHGLKEWGALKEPKTQEEKLVFLCDMVSSRLGRIEL